MNSFFGVILFTSLEVSCQIGLLINVSIAGDQRMCGKNRAGFWRPRKISATTPPPVSCCAPPRLPALDPPLLEYCLVGVLNWLLRRQLLD